MSHFKSTYLLHLEPDYEKCNYLLVYKKSDSYLKAISIKFFQCLSILHKFLNWADLNRSLNKNMYVKSNQNTWKTYFHSPALAFYNIIVVL